MKYSEAIEKAVLMAEAEGNRIEGVSTGWSKVSEVIYFEFPMTDKVREKIAGIPDLTYWKEDGTPHNRPEEGFVDEEDKVGITFPLEGYEGAPVGGLSPFRR